MECTIVADYIFLQFFWINKEGHLYILQTPLLELEIKETIYCYTDDEEKRRLKN
jgi:DNA gyrase/topoisomerase IV subunit B